MEKDFQEFKDGMPEFDSLLPELIRGVLAKESHGFTDDEVKFIAKLSASVSFVLLDCYHRWLNLPEER
ncbi:MAG: hypothetical protein FWC20_01880 [Oscillospiraceae bacterium]|nr:hypothetical protein [Oscillospiraceae bacterium]MCL2278142.1 hypothetical protein [Oscillospiraceae bacterium]